MDMAVVQQFFMVSILHRFGSVDVCFRVCSVVFVSGVVVYHGVVDDVGDRDTCCHCFAAGQHLRMCW